jgi:hypothetical protein
MKNKKTKSKAKANGELLHVKFDYAEGMRLRKNLLSSQVILLESVRLIRKYHSFRTEELDLKLKLDKKISALILNFRLLKRILPKLDDSKTSKFLKREEKIKENIKKKEEAEEERNEEIRVAPRQKLDDIELELQKINEKLRTLD